MHSDQSFSSKEGCQFPAIPGAQLQLWAVGIASVGIGPEILHWEHMAAHPHQLSPPGPTSDPSPQLGAALVQMGKVEALGGRLTSDHPSALQLVTPVPPLSHSTLLHPGPGGHPPVPMSTPLLLPHSSPHSQQSGSFSKWCGAPAEEAVKLLALAGRRGPGGEPEGRPGLEAQALPDR